MNYETEIINLTGTDMGLPVSTGEPTCMSVQQV